MIISKGNKGFAMRVRQQRGSPKNEHENKIINKENNKEEGHRRVKGEGTGRDRITLITNLSSIECQTFFQRL